MRFLLRNCAFVLGALLVLPALASARSAMKTWDDHHPLPAQLGPFHLSSLRKAKHSDETRILRVVDDRGRTTDVPIEIAFEDVSATLGVGKIDPKSDQPQLLIASYTGGAHCCVHIQILDFIKSRWRIVDVGTFDGEPLASFPSDIDGDGVADIDLGDDRFDYAFGSYADSWVPPRVFELRAGMVQDVSAAPRYRRLFEEDFMDSKRECLAHRNAACAALVADGYRLGRDADAWKIAMANVDPSSAWLPGCKVKEIEGECPKGKDFQPGEFRAALSKFLYDNGIAASPR